MRSLLALVPGGLQKRTRSPCGAAVPADDAHDEGLVQCFHGNRKERVAQPTGERKKTVKSTVQMGAAGTLKLSSYLAAHEGTETCPHILRSSVARLPVYNK